MRSIYDLLKDTGIPTGSNVQIRACTGYLRCMWAKVYMRGMFAWN